MKDTIYLKHNNEDTHIKINVNKHYTFVSLLCDYAEIRKYLNLNNLPLFEFKESDKTTFDGAFNRAIQMINQ